MAFPNGLFIFYRYFSEEIKDKTSKGIEFFRRQFYSCTLVKIFQVDPRIAEPPSAVKLLNIFVFIIELILDISNYFFQNIFHADNAGNATVLVHHHRNMDFATAQLP